MTPFMNCSIILATRDDAAILVNRHPSQVRRWCEPLACEVRTKALLYDIDAVNRALKTRRRVTVAKAA